jgi:hypothetical protein
MEVDTPCFTNVSKAIRRSRWIFPVSLERTALGGSSCTHRKDDARIRDVLLPIKYEGCPRPCGAQHKTWMRRGENQIVRAGIKRIS